jgi:chromosome partitioning protein
METIERTLAFLNVKGGVAKSTSCVYTALELHNRGYNVHIIDTDPQGTIARKGEKLPFPVDLYGEKDLKSYQAHKDTITLIDTPPGLLNIIEAAEKISDRIVLPTGYGPADINQTIRTYQATSAPAKVLFTRVDKRAVLYHQAVEKIKDLEIPTYTTGIRKLTDIAYIVPAQNKRTQVWKTSDYSAFVNEFLTDLQEA